jgi:hypothetical protein
MSARFVNVDRDTPLLFPADLREWIAEDHLVHFIVEAIEQPDVGGFKVNQTGSGQARERKAKGKSRGTAGRRNRLTSISITSRIRRAGS